MKQGEEIRTAAAPPFLRTVLIAVNGPFHPSHSVTPLPFQTIFFITAYLLPLLLIIGLYSIMLHRLWNQARTRMQLRLIYRDQSRP